MVKISDIVSELQAQIPRRTSMFSETVGISTITSTGTTATVTTSVPHKLSTGAYVNITGTKTPITISTLTRSGTTVTAVTATDHDLTEGYQDYVEIQGATEAGYNGQFTDFTVPNRRTFTYEVDTSPNSPATGTPLLMNGSAYGYNGRYEITSTGATTFTYTLEASLPNSASGTGVLKLPPRIAGVIDKASAIEAYISKYNSGTGLSDNAKAWMFATLEDSYISKSRDTTTDAISTTLTQGDYNLPLLTRVIVYVFYPVVDQKSPRIARDAMQDLLPYVTQSLFRLKLPSTLAVGETSPMSFVGHGFNEFLKPVYIHQFVFELQEEMSYDDGIDPDFNVAFRDISMDMIEVEGTRVIMEAEINLDEEPL